MYRKCRRVNVITPTYNDAHLYLYETVLSVQRQIFDQNNVEVVHTIIDDGSANKDSLKVLDKLSNLKSINLISKVNGGLSSARNYGISSIDSDYILPLDSDDIIHPCYINKVLEVNTDLKKVFYCTNWASFGKFKIFKNVIKPNPYNIRYSNYLPVTCLLNTKTLIKNKYDEDMKLGGEDWDLWIRLICNGYQVVKNNFTGFYHREHYKNMTLNTLKNISSIKNYLKIKYPKLYSKSYDKTQKESYPPTLYDLIKLNTSPLLRNYLINKIKK